MSESWYVTADCISVDELPPIWFMITGVIMQWLITGVIFPMVKNKNKNKPQNEPKEKPKTNTWHLLLQIVLVIYQIAKLIVVFYFSMDTFRHKLNTLQLSHWQNYQCLSSILLTSSNFKTVFINSIAIFGPDCCCGLGYIVCPMQMYWKSNKQDSKKMWGNPSLGLLNTLFLFVVAMISLIYLPFIFMYGIVGAIPVTVPLYGVWWCLECILEDHSMDLFRESIDKSGNDHTELLIKKQHEKEGFCKKLSALILGIFSWISSVSVPLAYAVLGIVMINIYSGINVIQAIEYTLNERHWVDYWSHTKSNISNGLDFISQLL